MYNVYNFVVNNKICVFFKVHLFIKNMQMKIHKLKTNIVLNYINKYKTRSKVTSMNKKFIYDLFTVLVTADTPSTNFVLNKTLALLNIPSFKDTIINCERNTIL